MILIVNKAKLKLIAGFILWSLLVCALVFYKHYATECSLQELSVAIDPGHGGVDSGTKDGYGNFEKAINLDIALHLRTQLSQGGLKVVMTRETDTDLASFMIGKTGRHRRDLLGRIRTARDKRCRYLISIHCDWSPQQGRCGASVFYNSSSPESEKLAGSIQEELNQILKKPGRVAPGRYFILRQKEITGVLVETGFLSNPDEARLLRNQDYQKQLALAIAKGILKICHPDLVSEPKNEAKIPDLK